MDRRAATRRPRGILLAMLILGTLVLASIVAKQSVSEKNVEQGLDAVVALLHQGQIDTASLEYVEDEHVIRGQIRRPEGTRGPKRFELRYGEYGAKEFFTEMRRYNEAAGGDPAKMVWPRPVKSSAAVWSSLLTLIPWIMFGIIIYVFFFRGLRSGGAGGNVLTFGKSRARLATKELGGVTFADVAGIEEAKGDVKEIIEFLKNPGRFQKLGGRIPRGIMLVGSPGTGKTLLARAIAGEADVPFFSICGSDFVEMFVGVGASRVRDLFKQARENSPCIIFLDEVDAVGRKRGTGFAGGHDEREQTLNAILVEMDGFDSDEGIIVIAATNRPDVLDPALLRPGRFDREITLDLPDLKGREEILRVHTRGVKLDPAVDLHSIARGTAAFSGAELAAMVNEAAIIAAMNDQEVVRQEDLEEGRDKIRWGREKSSRVISDEDRRITAYHEAGHAVAAHLLEEVEPLHKVTIIPRGMALGATMQLPERDRCHLARKQLLANITVLYAGRIAEQIACQDITAGAMNDIQRATELARRMVTEWGMSEEIGPIHYARPEEEVLLGQERPGPAACSEAMGLRIDEEVRRILNDCYARCEKLVRKHRTELERITHALLLKETLTGEEVKVLFEGGDIELPVERGAGGGLASPPAPAPVAAMLAAPAEPPASGPAGQRPCA